MFGHRVVTLFVILTMNADDFLNIINQPVFKGDSVLCEVRPSLICN
jgi:hypothetical protein